MDLPGQIQPPNANDVVHLVKTLNVQEMRPALPTRAVPKKMDTARTPVNGYLDMMNMVIVLHKLLTI